MGKERLKEMPFKTPEELAIALEKRARGNLARRVRDIAGQVTDETSDKWEALRGSLNYVEERQIREALPETGVIFDEGVTEGERQRNINMSKVVQGAALGTGIEKTIDNISEKLGYFDRLGKAWESFGISWDNGEYSKAIKNLFLGLFGFFNPEKEEKEQELSTNPENVKPQGKVDVTKETDELKYTAGINLLLRLENFSEKFSNDNQEHSILPGNIESTFLNSSFYNKSFQKLSETNISFNDVSNISNKEGLASRLKLVGITDSEAYEAIHLLQKREKVLDSIFKTRVPNWRNLSIKELLINLDKYSSFFTSLGKIDIDTLTTKGMDFVRLNFDDTNQKGALNEILEVELKDKKSPFFGLDINYIAKLYSIKTRHDFRPDSLLLGKEDEKTREFVNGFLEFKKNIGGTLKSGFFLGEETSRGKFNEFIDNQVSDFTPSQLLEFYLITGGDTNPDNFNRIQRGMIFLKVFSLLNTKPSLQGETYIYAFKEGILNESSKIHIPPELTEAISLIMRAMFEKAINSTWGMAQRLWGALDATERTVIIGTSLALLIGMVYFIKVASAGAWLARGIGIALPAGAIGGYGLAQIYNYFKENKPEELNKIEKDFGIKGPKEFEEKFLSSFTS